MLSRIIELSLRYRGFVILATLALAGVGLASFRQLPVDAFPDTTPVQVAVNTVAPALSPVEVERQITAPLEQAIAGLPGLVGVRSLSKFGLSQITATFADSIDVYLARQVVAERLGSVSLPPGTDRPALGPVSTGLGEVFQYILRSDTLSPAELRTLHHWVIRPQMIQVPGVAEVNTWGGHELQYHVIIEPALLVKYDLSLDDVANALARNNANAGGGYIEQAGEATIVQGLGLARSIGDIERMVIAAFDGVPVYVRDVARVEEGHAIRRGAVTAEGKGEAVLGLGFMLMGENSHEITRRLEQRLAAVSRGMPEGVVLEPVYSRTELVDKVLHTVRNNLLEGAILVVAVLFAFLGSLRAGLIVALAIPLSMLFAFSGMLQVGIAGSLMSLGAIDFGLVVDSSVIMVENAAHRLAHDTSGRDAREIVRDAALEVRRPTLFGELIIALVYLPILTLEGVEGKLFRPMALTVILALLGSMILSMTLMPALASLLLRSKGSAAKAREPFLMRALKRAYRPVLDLALKRRGMVLGVAALAVVSAGFVATRLGTEFAPRLREMAIVVNTVRLAGVSLSESVRYGTEIERHLLRAFPDEIEHIFTRTGTAEVATDPMGMEVSDVFITLAPRAAWKRADTQDALMAAMAAELEGLPGMRTVFTQPIEMRMNEMLAGIRTDVGIKLFGDDFTVLREKAGEIRRVVESIPGAADVTVEQLTGQPIMQVTVNREAIARYGIAAAEVLEVVEAIGGIAVGQVATAEGQIHVDLVMRIGDAYREDADAIKRLLIRAPGGERVPLGQLATIDVVEGPSTISREWAKRRIVIQTNVRGRDMGSFVAELEAAIDERVALPAGYYVKLGGQFENLQRARNRLLIVVPLALLLILCLLYVTYGRMLDALRVFTGVPFAAVGGIMALWLCDMPFSISAGVGFVALSGVAVLGDMVLVSRVRQLLQEGHERVAAIRMAAEGRLRPVLMTGMVAAFGFVPMALNTGVGAEVQRPLAVVVIGGVLTATLATLVVLPVLYAALARSERRT